MFGWGEIEYSGAMGTRVLFLVIRAVCWFLTPARLELLHRAEHDRRARLRAKVRLDTEVPDMGTVPARAYADRVAAAFLEWHLREGMAEFGAPSQLLAEVAEGRFAPETGIELPPMREFLGALKRHPRVHILKHYRLRGDDGKVRKVTMYMVSLTSRPQSCSLPGEMRQAA
jgi:hypothetical protein